MSDKKEKKNTTKKTAKKETVHTLKLDNNDEILAKVIFMRNSKHFNISDIDISDVESQMKGSSEKKINHTSTIYSMKTVINMFI